MQQIAIACYILILRKIPIVEAGGRIAIKGSITESQQRREDELKIINAPEGASVEIYNLMGSRIIQTTVNGGDDHIDLRRLSSGVYLLLLRDKEGRQTSQ